MNVGLWIIVIKLFWLPTEEDLVELFVEWERKLLEIFTNVNHIVE